jgi:hypothetical protein
VGLLSVVLARRSERRREITAVGILCAVAGLLYLATPLTGGGPNGFPSMIAANLRYFMPALVLGALLAVTVLPVKLGAAAAGGVLVWDLVELFHASTRAELRYPAVWIVVAVIVAAIGATIAAYHDRRPVRGAPAAALGILLALGAAGGAIWQSNRNPRTTPLDAAMTRVWRPGDVIGDVAARDFRSLMGIGLDRMLMMFPAGGRAGETPFKSARELDDAIARSNVRIIVFIAPGAVGPGVAGVYSVPKGWTPPPWCPAGGDRRVSVLVRPNADGSCPAIAG